MRYLASRIGRQASWLVIEKLLRIVTSVFVSALIARSLGPRDFGEYIFALQFVAAIAPFAVLGVESLVIKWLLRTPQDSARILGTALLVRLISSATFSLLITLLSFLFASGEQALILAVASLLLIPQIAGVLHRYYLYKYRSRDIFSASAIAIAISITLRVIAVTLSLGVVPFLAIALIEHTIILLVYLLHLYRKSPSEKVGRADLSLARAMIGKSIHIVPLHFAGVFLLTLEYFMLKTMSTPAELGYYTAAARITESWYALQAAIVAAYTPILMSETVTGEARLTAKIQSIFSLVTKISIAAALLVTVLASSLIGLLYGGEFSPAGPVLTISIWAAVFSGWRQVSGTLLQASGQPWIAFRRVSVGIAVGGVVGVLFIPNYGAIGAAWSVLCGQMAAGFLADFIGTETQLHATAKLRALLPFWRG